MLANGTKYFIVTPVMLIHQEGRRTKKQIEAMAAVTSKSETEEYFSTTPARKQKIYKRFSPY